MRQWMQLIARKPPTGRLPSARLPVVAIVTLTVLMSFSPASSFPRARHSVPPRPAQMLAVV